MTKQEKPNKEELRQASKHLLYEVTMFRNLSQIMALDGGVKGVLHSALLEAFMIHLRILIEFFYTKKRAHQDTMLAGDFFSSPEKWRQIRPLLSVSLKKAKERVNQEAAHLTYHRSTILPEDKFWKFGELYLEIEATIRKFEDEVDEELLDPLWKAQLKNRPETNFEK